MSEILVKITDKFKGNKFTQIDLFSICHFFPGKSCSNLKLTEFGVINIDIYRLKNNSINISYF